jgi:hypothetical protein
MSFIVLTGAEVDGDALDEPCAPVDAVEPEPLLLDVHADSASAAATRAAAAAIAVIAGRGREVGEPGFVTRPP